MKIFKRKSIVNSLVAITLTGLILTSCSNHNDTNNQTVPKSKNTLVISLSSDVPSLDPDLLC